MYAYTKDRQTSTMDRQSTDTTTHEERELHHRRCQPSPTVEAGEKGDGSEELVRRKMLVHLVGVRLAQAA